MLKRISFLVLIIFSFLPVFGQAKLGLRLAPSLSMTRIVDNNATIVYSSNGAGLRFSAGPMADFFFSENYAVTTGVFYSVKRVSAQANNIETDQYANLQYIQVPLGLKFFTNEITTDFKLYFSLGGTASLKIKEKHKNFPGATPPDNLYKIIDAGIFVGGGMEYNMGPTNVVFLGINYDRGLINIIKGNSYGDDIAFFTTSVALEAGIKF